MKRQTKTEVVKRLLTVILEGTTDTCDIDIDELSFVLTMYRKQEILDYFFCMGFNNDQVHWGRIKQHFYLRKGKT